MPYPTFVVLRSGNPTLSFFDKTPANIKQHDTYTAVPAERTTVAPVRFDKALRAIHGLEAWDPSYDVVKHSTYFEAI